MRSTSPSFARSSPRCRTPRSLRTRSRSFRPRGVAEQRRRASSVRGELLDRRSDSAAATARERARGRGRARRRRAAVIDPSDAVAGDGPRRCSSAPRRRARCARGSRALIAIGRVEAWRADPGVAAAGRGALAEAAALCAARSRARVAGVGRSSKLGYRVAFARGDLERGDHAHDGRPRPAARARSRAVRVATFLGVGARLRRAASTRPTARSREADEIGRRLGDHRARAPTPPGHGRRSPRYAVTRAATIQRIRAVERHPGEWFEHPTGAEFLAERGARARPRRRAPSSRSTMRRARPASAPRRSAIRRSPGSRPARSRRASAIRRWLRPTLECVRGLAPAGAARRVAHAPAARALAAQRAGDPPCRGAGGARPTRPPSALGHPDLPALPRARRRRLRRELARAAGSAAASIYGAERSHRVTLLGGFGVSADGRAARSAPPGRASTLVEAAGAEPAGAGDGRRGGRASCGPARTAPPAGGGCATCSTALRASLRRARRSRRRGARARARRRGRRPAASKRAAAAVRAAVDGERAGLARAALARYAGRAAARGPLRGVGDGPARTAPPPLPRAARPAG